MARQQKQAYCSGCRQNTLHVKNEPARTGCGTHLMLSIFTLGIWIPFAAMLIAIEQWGGILARWHCQRCGKKR